MHDARGVESVELCRTLTLHVRFVSRDGECVDHRTLVGKSDNGWTVGEYHLIKGKFVKRKFHSVPAMPLMHARQNF